MARATNYPLSDAQVRMIGKLLDLVDKRMESASFCELCDEDYDEAKELESIEILQELAEIFPTQEYIEVRTEPYLDRG
jgi:hypothetical protein